MSPLKRASNSWDGIFRADCHLPKATLSRPALIDPHGLLCRCQLVWHGQLSEDRISRVDHIMWVRHREAWAD